MLFLFLRLEHTIGKQPPLTNEDRSKFTVLARMQRVEGTIRDLGQSLDNVYTLLKNMDGKLDRLSHNNNNIHQRSTRSVISNIGVKFPSVQEEIPRD